MPQNTPGFLECFGSLVQGFLLPHRHYESGEGPGMRLKTITVQHSLRKQMSFRSATTGVPAKRRLCNEHQNTVLAARVDHARTQA